MNAVALAARVTLLPTGRPDCPEIMGRAGAGSRRASCGALAPVGFFFSDSVPLEMAAAARNCESENAEAQSGLPLGSLAGFAQDEEPECAAEARG